MTYPIISADSHITEAPNTYIDYIDPKYRDTAPRFLEEEEGVAWAVRDKDLIRIGGAAAAGIPPAERKKKIRKLADVHPSGWNSATRLADQERDGVSAEVLYPTLGMIICDHPDVDYKHACFQAYNRWISDYCSIDPTRLLGMGQTAMRSPKDGIADFAAIKAQGLRGVMMPGKPGTAEDYDSPIYDEFWAAAAESGLPVTFHIIAAGGLTRKPTRGSTKLAYFMELPRGVQDVITMLILGGIFERHPKLRIVCAEGDAGWVPHYAHRIDRSYTEHRHVLDFDDLRKMPSDYLYEHVYFTFQDDPIAFRLADAMNWKRLMWANDFPHSDSTWPNSQALLEKHTQFVNAEQKQAILSSNAAELYNINFALPERFPRQ